MDKQEILKVIDKIIERANEIRVLQREIGANLIGEEEAILIYDVNAFLEYAEIAGAEVMESGYVSKDIENHHIRFYHNGFEFSAFIPPETLQEIREKVLPPTKVTEPNQNA